MTQQPQLRYFNTGELAIHYAERDGDSESQTLFIHGITGRQETWDEVAGRIRGQARAIAVDLRGHGRSGHTTGAYLLTDYARDIASLIAGLGLAPVTIVGHSLGAMTTLQLAASRPDLVRAIVLEDPPLFARHIMENFAPERFERFANNANLSGSGLSLEQMATEIRQASPEAIEDEVQRSALSMFVTDADAIQHVVDGRIDWSQEIEGILKAVKCPALLMQGNFDLGGWMLAEDGERAKSLLPDCQLETWSDTGHLLHTDNPERFIQQVNSFIAGLKAAN